MANVTVTVPDGKVAEVIEAFEFAFAQAPGETFTGAQWVRECLRRFVVKTHRRYKLHQAETAVTGDDTIAS